MIKSEKKKTSENTDEISFTGERYVPGIDDPVMQMEHMQRYFSVCNVIIGLDVLDVACGEGYGSDLMANVASNVYGVDINHTTIEHARTRYKRENLKFIQGSATDLSVFQDKSIDAVVSFETIEHIDEVSQQMFLKEIKRILKPDGFLIMSTPDKKIYSDLRGYHNDYHVHEFYKDEFVAFLKGCFNNVILYDQYFEVTGIIENEQSIDSKDTKIMCFGNKHEEDGKYLIAVASDRDISSLDLSSVYKNPTCEYEEKVTRIVELQDDVEERNNHIQKLDEQIANMSKRIVELQDDVEKCHNTIDEYQRAIDEYQRAIDDYNRHLHLFGKLKVGKKD